MTQIEYEVLRQRYHWKLDTHIAQCDACFKKGPGLCRRGVDMRRQFDSDVLSHRKETNP